MASTCAKCGIAASSSCSRCNKVVYCSRNCQVEHWKAGHSKECVDPLAQIKRYNTYLECAHQRIAGNIMIMAAHKFSRAPGVIFVEINETAAEFAKESQEHFAHLLYASAAEYENIAKTRFKLNNFKLADEITASPITVVYVLEDYKLVMRFKSPYDIDSVKKNSKEPYDEWSIPFKL